MFNVVRYLLCQIASCLLIFTCIQPLHTCIYVGKSSARYLPKVSGFLPVLGFPLPLKLISKVLKVALNTNKSSVSKKERH